jgi:hypothetical protein
MWGNRSRILSVFEGVVLGRCLMVVVGGVVPLECVLCCFEFNLIGNWLMVP